MSFENSPFAKSLYISGTPKKGGEKQVTGSPSGGSQFVTPKRTTTTTPSTKGSPQSASKFSTPPNAYRPSTPSEVPTGSWEHPSLKDIRRRTVNKELVLRKVLVNIAVLISIYLLGRLAKRGGGGSLSVYVDWIKSQGPILSTVMTYGHVGLQLLCFFNVVVGLSQIFQPPERFDDLPITPSQRKLLGLPDSPNSAKSSPSPPRYLKSSPQARVSPRPSPLSKSSSSPLSKGSAVFNTPSKSANNSNTNTPSKQTNGLSNNSPNSATATPFTPTGRYLYMTDSPNRRSSLRRL
jgi:nucleoporin POM34